MQIIEKEKNIHFNKQQLLFRGMILEKQNRLNDYNISHEIHLLKLK